MAAQLSARREEWGLWSRWVVANAVGEALGLGTTALVGLALFAAYGEATGTLATLAVALAAILAGTAIEGVTVGTAQWLVLRRPLPGIAWTLGMLPSTLLALGQEPGEATATEPSALAVYALAFLMGLVLGPILGCAQWLVLRRHLPRAGLWMPAHALAWAFGMVLVFAVVSAVVDRGLGPGTIALAILGLAATGAVVGGVHGLALVRLLDRLPRPARAQLSA